MKDKVKNEPQKKVPEQNNKGMQGSVIHISVRNMVEFVSRSGSLDSRYVSSVRAQEGIRIHKKIQKMRKNEAALKGHVYESEFTLKHSFVYKACTFHIEGRADGIQIEEDNVSIEEIKSTTKELDDIFEDLDHWHWAQAICYGYMYCVNFDSPRAKLLLTYCNVESGAYKTFAHIYDKEAFEALFFDFIEKYYAYAELDMMRIAQRNETGAALVFPFDGYRKGQREMAVSVYGAVMKEKRLFAQAPTGTGKTVSAMFPSVKALAEGLIEKIFYITARNATREAAEKCLALLAQKGLVMRSITITAKEKICPNEKKAACNPVDCPYADGHFDRVNAAIMEIIQKERLIHRTCVEAYAMKHRVCPYEYTLDLTHFCDCVICDYNYVYDPKVRLRRYFSEGDKNNFVVLVDEAHNMVDRAREMFSADILKSEILEARKAFKSSQLKIYKILNNINKALLEIGRAVETEIDGGANVRLYTELPPNLMRKLLDFRQEADKWLAANEGGQGYDAVISLYFRVLDFFRIYELFDNRYVCLVSCHPGRDVSVKLLCLDPSWQLLQGHQRVRSVVFFSGTLMPLPFFQDVLGGTPEDYTLRLQSPFDPENFRLLVHNAISTKYRDRAYSYAAIADIIYDTISAKKGNYMVFFPSYAYLDRVVEQFSERYGHIRAVIQTRGGSQAPDEAGKTFLDHFTLDNEETLVGFAVLGGSYSEGIDLTGDRLIGVVVVGVGLPLITAERNIIRDYYGENAGLGYEYAYMYPGMNKVMQAAGRVIRKEDDRGVVVLVDSRFLNSGYRAVFPDEWMGYVRVGTRAALQHTLAHFWHGGDEKGTEGQ